MESCDVRKATHVEYAGGIVEKIVEKRGIYPNGGYAPPSKGGFGVVTESGRFVTMFDAHKYFFNPGDEIKLPSGRKAAIADAKRQRELRARKKQF